jgi:hypothetical protein
MSHPVQELRDESVGQWLPLIEYSVRTGVSLSTIRRKIKSNSIPFRLEKGKYLILLSSNAVNSSSNSQQKWDGMRDRNASMKAEQPHTLTSSNPHYHLNEEQSALEAQLAETQRLVSTQQVRIRELENELEEMTLLVQTLEQQYGVKY